MICDVCNACVEPDDATCVSPARFRKLLDLGFGFDAENLKMLTANGMPEIQARTLLRHQYLQSTSDWLLCDDCANEAEHAIQRSQEVNAELESDTNTRPGSESPVAPRPTEGWWRWPLVPICAAIASVVGSSIFGMVGWAGAKAYGGLSEDGWYYLYIMPTVTSGILGFIWCSVSGYVAPYAKPITCVVMATILAMFGLYIVIEHFARPDQYSTSPVLLLALVVAMVIGAVIATVHQFESPTGG